MAGTIAALTMVLSSAQLATGATPDPSMHGRITSTIARMTLEEKVGQLFVTYAYGETADDADPANAAANVKAYGVRTPGEVVARYHLGGVIYFAWSDNVNNPRQIAGLSNGLQQVATNERARIPLMISTDQEYGVVFRVGPPATQFPGNMALGAGRSTGDAYSAGTIGGRELRAVGVNQDFAPVADVNVNAANPVIGVRSFGENPALVSDMVASAVAGYEQPSGVSATAKHFPGHGDTNTDSHTGIPIIYHSREELERIDLPPFKAAIAQGIDSIMTAHIIVPALDPSEDPATLSKPIMTGLLREKLGYDGVVITDSLGMAGVRAKYGDDRVPVLALQAGVDQLLMPPNLDLAYSSVLAAVRSGELTEKRIDQSVYRVLRMKWQRGVLAQPFVDPNAVDAVVGTAAHRAEAQRIADRTPTLLKDEANVLPIRAAAGKTALVTGWGVSSTATVDAAMEQRGVPTETYETGTAPSAAKIAAARQKADRHDLVVVLTNKAWTEDSQDARGTGQQQLVKQLVATGKPVVVVAVRDPYDINRFAQASTYLASYSYADVSLQSAVKVLFGEIAPSGRLPVTIPTADGSGVLYPYGAGLAATS
jgi:beta-N-acetylhexosaminidase